MSHMVGKDAYKSLEERLNRFPQGAPPSETLYKILSMMFTKEEASLVAKLPIKPFNIKTASKLCGVREVKAEGILQSLASKALILDLECANEGEQKYMMAPPMAGFFEFALMRVGTYLDQKVLSELFHQYLNVENDFSKDLFWGTETKLGRAFVQERVLEDLCLGCGVCVKNCKTNAIKLIRRKENVITPVTTVHRAVLSAIEKGQLQNLIFDNQAHLSHKAMAAVLASILKLSPVQKAMASKQMKSVYLAKLLENS